MRSEPEIFSLIVLFQERKNYRRTALSSDEMNVKFCSEVRDDVKVRRCPSQPNKYSVAGAQTTGASAFYVRPLFASCRRILGHDRRAPHPCQTSSMRLFNAKLSRTAFPDFPSQLPSKDRSFSETVMAGQTLKTTFASPVNRFSVLVPSPSRSQPRRH